MFWPDEGSLLLYWMRRSLLRSLSRVRSSARLYRALAERETDQVSRDFYGLLAEQQRGRAARKIMSLFNLRVRLPVDTDPFATRVWRRLLILCGPRLAVAWIEWRGNRELTLIIAAARAAVRLTRLRDQCTKRPV